MVFDSQLELNRTGTIINQKFDSILVLSSKFGQHGISSKKLRSHLTSLPTLSKAMNSNFMVDIQVCFVDLYDITPSPIVNTYPLAKASLWC